MLKDKVKLKYRFSYASDYLVNTVTGGTNMMVAHNSKLISFDKYFKNIVMTLYEFKELHNTTIQSVKYLIETNVIDSITFNTVQLVEMTDKTRQYTPNKNKNRLGTLGNINRT